MEINTLALFIGVSATLMLLALASLLVEGSSAAASTNILVFVVGWGLAIIPRRLGLVGEADLSWVGWLLIGINLARSAVVLWNSAVKHHHKMLLTIIAQQLEETKKQLLDDPRKD